MKSAIFLATIITLSSAWYMQEESEEHDGSWMAFTANPYVWGDNMTTPVREALARVARAISDYEPLHVIVPPEELAIAQQLIGARNNVYYYQYPLNDFWIRDSGPTFVFPSENDFTTLRGIDFNFNGWGQKQEHDADKDVASIATTEAGFPVLGTDLVMEQGCVEVDGEGTAIAAESCLLIDNRNPGWTKQDVEAELKHLLGLTKIIWIKGIKGKDITDGHTDFYARFASPGKVIAALDNDTRSYDHQITKDIISTLESATDAEGRQLEVTVLTHPPWNTIRTQYRNNDFAAGYVGYYVINGAVIMQEFGSPAADAAAKAAIQQHFPNRDIVQLNVDAIAHGGGSIHCATQQQPAIE